MLTDFKELGNCIKRNILQEYFLKTKIKIVVAKKKLLSVIQSRSDYQSIQVSESKDKEIHRQLINELYNSTQSSFGMEHEINKELVYQISKKISKYNKTVVNLLEDAEKKDIMLNTMDKKLKRIQKENEDLRKQLL